MAKAYVVYQPERRHYCPLHLESERMELPSFFVCQECNSVYYRAEGDWGQFWRRLTWLNWYRKRQYKRAISH